MKYLFFVLSDENRTNISLKNCFIKSSLFPKILNLGMRFWLVLLFIIIFNLGFSQVEQAALPADTLSPEVNTEPLDSLKSDKVDQMIGFAKKYLGIPYKYAGSSPAGFDCSGFINYVLKKYNFDISRSSASMAAYGKRVKLAEVRKGDLLFFKGSKLSSTVVGHVGMVIENENGIIRFIHSANNGGVQITTFNGSKYYVPRFIMAKRLEY